ncbi:MAG: T9SS type A sorting domain-containing protein [Flavobacteriales bacterium]|nr:T9SS type A sorting domain-containing protein [Flavobacteriales bacterium]
MRNLQLFCTITLFFCISKTCISQIVPKSYWENFTTADGLISNNIQDVFIQDKSNVWLATDLGLSHFDGTIFTNYTTANSTLPDNDIKEIVYTQNKLWLRRTSGLSSFDGTVFINYTTANGLLNNSIRDITHTTNDTLWMCSGSGVSKFDGVNFTHYPSRMAFVIEADNSNRIYAALILGTTNVNFVSLYENGLWTNPTSTGQSSVLYGLMGLKLTKDGDLLAIPHNNLAMPQNNIKEYYKISYPLNYESKRVILGVSNPHTLGGVNLRFIEKMAGKLWAGCYSPRFICSTTDSIAKPYIVNNLNVFSSTIDLFQDVIAVGTVNAGLYIANSSIETNDKEEGFSVNQIKTSVRITDPVFSNTIDGMANFEYPKTSGNHGIYTANFIVAAKKVGQFSYTVHPLNINSPSFAPGPISNTAGLPDNYLVKVSTQEILSHQTSFNHPGYTIPKGIEEWPAYGDSLLGIATDLAPFVDFNSNGCYDPQNGDYPIIKGDEAIYWINHPDDQNLELEYHWMLYGFNSPNTELDQTLFLQYTIVNRAVEVYDSVKVGFYFDADLGASSDDYVGCDSLNDILYSYNGYLTDPGTRGSPGYGNRVPAIGVKFLSDRLSNLMHFGIGVFTGAPSRPQDWINMMNSRWKYGQQLRYGGNGFNSAGVTTNTTTHMFTGNPYLQTGWTEITPGGIELSNHPGDRTLFGSIPYFSLQPNERKSIEIVVGFGKNPDTNSVIGQNISTLVNVLNAADSAWNTIVVSPSSWALTDSCNVITSLVSIYDDNKEKLRIYPIPTTNDLTIESPIEILEVQLFDMKGVLMKQYFDNRTTVILGLGDLEGGFYMLRVRNLNEEWENKKIVVMKQ